MTYGAGQDSRMSSRRNCLFSPEIMALGVDVESRPIQNLRHLEREQIERISILTCFLSFKISTQLVSFGDLRPETARVTPYLTVPGVVFPL
jgi:hypothetical protein